MVLLPNAFIAFDAAIPSGVSTKEGESDLKTDMFGEEHSGAFGLGIGKERYWGTAFEWLAEQDQDISNPADRPAFISWWDYGFYEVAMGDHPTVADNFQDGIPPASNFHTAVSENEAVAVLIVRLLEGDVKQNSGKLSADVKTVLQQQLGADNASKIGGWIENPTISPSYKKSIAPEFLKYVRDAINNQHLTVGSQWPEIAAYHDIVEFLTNETHGFTDEQITMLYHEVQRVTGWSIRYYGVEGYDKDIFNIFAFLSDKSLLMVGAPKDDFVQIIYMGKQYQNLNDPDSGVDMTWTAQQLYDMSDYDKKFISVEDQTQNYLDPYYDTMFYRTYFGSKESDKIQIPCVGMKHFYAEYISDMYYYQGISAVVIAKYYEGAIVTGKLVFNNSGVLGPMDTQVVVTKELVYPNVGSFDIPHDKVNATNGNFSVVVGAGGIIKIMRYPELDSGIPWYGGKAFVVKEIDLNISDDDAMRKTINWQIDLGNVTIEPANLSGYVFNNLDNNASYDSSTDEPISNVSIEIQGINKMQITEDEFGNPQVLPGEYDFTMMRSTTTDDNGSYNFTGLKPGYYVMQTSIDNIPIDRSLVPLPSGKNSANVSKPKDASVEGYVYYDEDQNNKRDSGEEIKQAEVELLYGEKTIKETTI